MFTVGETFCSKKLCENVNDTVTLLFWIHKYIYFDLDLGWNSLKQRRTKHDLTLFYQAVNGHIEIPLPPYVIPVKRNNKSYHEKGYIQMFAKNDQYKNSFIPRTIPIWNRLPLAIVNSSNTETFKLALSKLSSC